MQKEIADDKLGVALDRLKQNADLKLFELENKIRGIISASDISRKLKLPLDISMNSSFVSIFNVLVLNSDLLQSLTLLSNSECTPYSQSLGTEIYN